MIGTIFSCIKSFFVSLVILLSSTLGLSGSFDRADPSLKPPEWPVWVHDHWVWENSGTQVTAKALVDGYLERDIPVGAIIIDRPWATDSNTFIPDPGLYPDLGEQVDMYHEMNIRVIIWATSIVNETASNYQEGKEKGYFLSNGKAVKWWGGKGALIDYTNPEAVEWWHRQMDNILDMGIDGWKVDGTDPCVMLLMPAVGYGDKFVTWAEYREQVYNDFYEYTRSRLGKGRVISARPVDDQLFRIGIPLLFADRDNNFAGWVGDNDNDWAGLRHALNNMFTSSLYNFVSYGSDIGGFRSDGVQYKDVFVRWAQLGAFCPVMENGGGGEHRPWMFDGETVDIYRKYVLLHNELIPYIYSQAAYSYEINEPTMRPQAGKYEYLLGDDILVAPFYEEGSVRKVVFPKGEWIYMLDESKVYKKGTEKLNFCLDEFPVFIRKGAIIPMNVVGDDSGHGTELSADYTTVAVYPKNGEKKSGLYEEGKDGSMISYTKDDDSLTLKCTASDRSMLFRVYGEPAPEYVSGGNGTALSRANSMAELTTMQSGFFTEGGITWIAVKDVTAGAEVNISY